MTSQLIEIVMLISGVSLSFKLTLEAILYDSTQSLFSNRKMYGFTLFT